MIKAPRSVRSFRSVKTIFIFHVGFIFLLGVAYALNSHDLADDPLKKHSFIAVARRLVPTSFPHGVGGKSESGSPLTMFGGDARRQVAAFRLVVRKDTEGVFKQPANISAPMARTRIEPGLWDDAESDEPPRRRSRLHRPFVRRVFFQMDIWNRADAFEDDEQPVRNFAQSVVASGYNSALATIDQSGGLGLRFGLFYPVPGRWEAGGSLGYVLGPTQDVRVTGRSGALGDGVYAEETETDFFRALAEISKEIDLAKWMAVRFRAGVGFATGNIRSKRVNAGSFVTALGLPTERTVTHEWNGFTWEFIPSLVFRGTLLDVEIGVGWSGFPKMDKNPDFNEFEWNPVGLRLGLEFN